MQKTIEKLDELGFYVDNNGIASYTGYVSDVSKNLIVKVDLHETFLLCASNVIGDMIEKAYLMGRKDDNPPGISIVADNLLTSVKNLKTSINKLVFRLPEDTIVESAETILPAINAMTKAINKITEGY